MSVTPQWDYCKGLPQRHPFVTVRLETPVIYFYPPKGQTSPVAVDVDVSLHGGWLTEFYPSAEARRAPGLRLNTLNLVRCAHHGHNRKPFLETSDDRRQPPLAADGGTRVARTRQTAATPVETSDGEAEKYLFYRGWQFQAPLSIRHDVDRNRLDIRGNFSEVLSSGERATVNAAWLVHIRPDGNAAFRRAAAFDVGDNSNDIVATLKSDFALADYDAGNIRKLKQEMLQALAAAGLYEDEARAMLDTWNRAYFQKAGLRVFSAHAVWTDARMPLAISVPADMTRVMVGCIELESPEQRGVKRLASAVISDPSWVRQLPNSANAWRFRRGQSDFGDLGVPIPPDYQMYLDLGRFRNALVVAEAHRHPSESLRKFIATYQLEDFQPAAPAPGPGPVAVNHD